MRALAVLQAPGARPRAPGNPIPCDGSISPSGKSKLGHEWTDADSYWNDPPLGGIYQETK